LKPDLENAMERIAFWPASENRKVQFRLDTTIWRDSSGTYLLKTPANEQSRPFIDLIEGRERSAGNFFKGKASVVDGTKQQNGLLYPLLPHPTFEKLVADRLGERDGNGSLAVINDYLDLLRGLPSQGCVPEQFLAFIGGAKKKTRESFLCFTAGPIDLIPRNVLVADSSYYMIDHEWFLDFPVPVDFVIYRGLTSLIFNLQREIRANAAESAVTLFSGYGTNRAYMPLTWAAFLGKLALPLGEFNTWNSHFQQQVLLSSPAFRLRFNLHATGCACPGVSDKALPKTAPLLAQWQFKGELASLKLKEAFQTMREKLYWKK
jgi:hypothetical protein